MAIRPLGSRVLIVPGDLDESSYLGRRFKQSASAALKKIALVYPALRLETIQTELIVHPSPAAIPPKLKRLRIS
jgi:hypothetical protein